MSNVAAILEQRARAYARPLAAAVDAAAFDAVFFEIGGERFAIEAAVVARIASLQQVTRLPGTPAYVPGITNVRGTLIPVFDLARLLGIPNAANAAQLLVLGRDALEAGIRVSAVTDIAAMPVVPAGNERTAPIVRRVLPNGRALIDGAALLDDPRLVLGAGPKPPEELHR